MQLQWQRQGEWIDCVYPPCDFATALSRYQEYQDRNPMHLYRIIPTGGYSYMLDNLDPAIAKYA